MFGPEDDFFNKFGWLARLSPMLPLIGGGKTKLQPVFVGDIARATAKVLDDTATAGKIYELGGLEIMTLKEVMELTLKETRRNRLLLPVPFGLARIKAAVLGLLPKPLLTLDQVRLLESDSVVSDEHGDVPRSRHRAGGAGGDRPLLSLAVPQARRVRTRDELRRRQRLGNISVFPPRSLVPSPIADQP